MLRLATTMHSSVVAFLPSLICTCRVPSTLSAALFAPTTCACVCSPPGSWSLSCWLMTETCARESTSAWTCLSHTKTVRCCRGVPICVQTTNCSCCWALCSLLPALPCNVAELARVETSDTFSADGTCFQLFLLLLPHQGDLRACLESAKVCHHGIQLPGHGCRRRVWFCDARCLVRRGLKEQLLDLSIVAQGE